MINSLVESRDEVAAIQAFAPVVSLTLAYNGLTGAWWGNAGNGGADGWGEFPIREINC